MRTKEIIGGLIIRMNSKNFEKHKMFLKMTKNHENHKLKMKNPGIHPINSCINQGYKDVGDKWMLVPDVNVQR